MARKKLQNPRIEEMNAYAVRVWEGQSPDLSSPCRVRRVVDGLIAQGYEDVIDSLVLPCGDYKQWL